MKSGRCWLSLIAVLLLTFPALSQKKDIVGYFPSWKWRSGKNLVSPATIPYEKLTIINYAFFYPRPDGSLVGRDSAGDEKMLRGDPDPASGGRSSSLIELAHRHGVRVLLSIGGWEDSGNFPEVASSSKGRATFAHACVEAMRRYGFDGIDIDWEYPCFADHNGKPRDKQNFTLLLQVTRDSLNAFRKSGSGDFLLTAALPAGAQTLANFEMDKIPGLLDRLNVMTYDFVGTWDSRSGHNAPLYAPSDDDSLRNVDAAFRLYTVTYKVAASKVNLGVPFYGHTFANCTTINGTHSGPDTIHFAPQGCFYDDLAPRINEFTRYWDDRAKVPYLVNASWRTLISYDDEESVACKSQYVLDHDGAGLIIWEITGDVMPDGRTPLLDVIARKFFGTK